MSNKDPNEKCENCKYFANERGQTQCRKYAPRRGDGGKPWANVEKIDWCSEFKKNLPDGPSQKIIETIKRNIG